MRFPKTKPVGEIALLHATDLAIAGQRRSRGILSSGSCKLLPLTAYFRIRIDEPIQ
jgi:hypothetical protein